MNTTMKSINQNKMKKTAVEWLIGRFHYEGFIGTYCSEEQIKSKREIMIEIIEQAKEMEKEQMRYFIQVGYYAHSQGHKKDEELYNYWIDNYNRE